VTRVNVDDVAFMDRRFKLLGGRLGITWQEALGRCLPVWALAYAKRTAILPSGDIDALGERPGFAAAMCDVDLAAEDEGGLYLRGVADRIDFLLIQDAKREKARRAKLDAAGIASPRRPSRGTSRPRAEVPAAPSPGTIPEEGPYSPDLDLDLAPDLEDLPPARAIPPTPEPPATPPAAPAPPPDRGDAALRHRQSLRAAIWADLAAARAAVAAELGLPKTDGLLLAFDQGENALAMRLLGARDPAELELIASQARKAIAVIAAEAREARSLEWLTGAVFESDRAWRRAVGKSLTEIGRPTKAAQDLARRFGQGAAPRPAGPRRKEPAPPIAKGADPAELLALAAAAREQLYGTGEPRAGPASARLATDDEWQPEPGKATPA
jgi:hypothetical protein